MFIVYIVNAMFSNEIANFLKKNTHLCRLSPEISATWDSETHLKLTFATSSSNILQNEFSKRQFEMPILKFE